jgi:CcmD family protein
MTHLYQSAPAIGTAASPDGRAGEFRAVEGGPEMRSGALLLVEAYAAIWLVLFVFVWLTARRQARLESRLDELENALGAARKDKR